MAKKPRVRLKTKKELADTDFLRRSARRQRAYKAALAVGNKLKKERLTYVRDVAADEWYFRFDQRDVTAAVEKETRRWDRLRKQFLKEATDPLELHMFALKWNYDRGLGPIKKIVTSPYCDAGTALLIYWINDPYYYQQYRLISEADGEEREMLRIMRGIEHRLKQGDFRTSKIPFDPTPWIEDTERDWAVHKIPDVMHRPVKVTKPKKHK